MSRANGPFQPSLGSIFSSSTDRRFNAPRVLEELGPLGAVGQRHDQREPIAFDLLTDLAPQVLVPFVRRTKSRTGLGKNRSRSSWTVPDVSPVKHGV